MLGMLGMLSMCTVGQQPSRALTWSMSQVRLEACARFGYLRAGSSESRLFALGRRLRGATAQALPEVHGSAAHGSAAHDAGPAGGRPRWGTALASTCDALRCAALLQVGAPGGLVLGEVKVGRHLPREGVVQQVRVRWGQQAPALRAPSVRRRVLTSAVSGSCV